MEWILWIIGYLAVGGILLVVLYKAMEIDWEAEATDTKLLMIATPVAWPLVLLFIAFVKVFMR